MRLAQATFDHTLSNEDVIHRCAFETGPKIFDILIRQYQSPIRAAFRELMCNAADSHVQAGKHDVPFEVRFKSVNDDLYMVGVRDFGVGMDHETVINLYGTMGRSDKTDSENVTGCLGIGSKAPLAYAEFFEVDCYDGEMVRSYCVTRTPEGDLIIINRGTEFSSEPQGVEVSFPVTSKNYSSALLTLERLASRFGHPHSDYTVRPDIYSADGTRHRPSDSLTKVHGFVYCGDTLGGDFVKVRMGNVSYRVDWTHLKSVVPQVSKDIDVIGQGRLTLCLPLDGKDGRPFVTFPPSRESIESTDSNARFICEQIKLAADQVIQDFNKHLDRRSNLMDATCAMWVHSNSKNLIDRCRYKGKPVPESVTALLSSVTKITGAYPEQWDDADNYTYTSASRRQLVTTAKAFNRLRNRGVILVDSLKAYRIRVNEAGVRPIKMIRCHKFDADKMQRIADELKRLGIPCSRVSDYPEPERKVKPKVSKHDNIFMRIIQSKSELPTEFWGQHADTPEQMIVADMSAWDAKVFGSTAKLHKHRAIDNMVTSALMPDRFTDSTGYGGLRKSAWNKKELPPNCESVNSFLTKEILFWLPWARWIDTLQTIHSAYISTPWLASLVDHYDEFRLNPTTRESMRRLSFLVRFYEKIRAKQYVSYVNSLQSAVGGKVDNIQSNDDTIDEVRSMMSSYVDENLSPRFQLMNPLSNYVFRRKEEEMQDIVIYINAVEAAKPEDKSLLFRMPKLPPLTSRKRVPVPFVLDGYEGSRPILSPGD